MWKTFVIAVIAIVQPPVRAFLPAITVGGMVRSRTSARYTPRGVRQVKEHASGELEAPLWLGLDLSTQSLTAVVLKGGETGPASKVPVLTEKVIYNDLSAHEKFGAIDGMVVSEGGARVTAPVLMWLHALERLLSQLQKRNGEKLGDGDIFSMHSIRCGSVSCQQHGTVYWQEGASHALQALKENTSGSEKGILSALESAFAITLTPIWADSSTRAEALEFESLLSGAAAVASITGSRAYLRQGAAQIKRILRENPKAYSDTERISLVCSFLPSVLMGGYCPIDASDGTGMNLMNLRTRKWDEACLNACAPGLRDKLGGDAAIVDSHEVVGVIGKYFASKYGFSDTCTVVAGSGDNCCSLAGMGVISLAPPKRQAYLRSTIPEYSDNVGGAAMISLGTSDTLLGVTLHPNPGIIGNTMRHPCDPNAYFAMLVYKNGGLVRRRIRDEYAKGDWGIFSDMLRSTAPGNEGRLGLYLDQPEITPEIDVCGTFKEGSTFTAAQEVRAVVEQRFLSMRYHAAELGLELPSIILATGGGSSNAAVLQVLSDVFQAPVYASSAPDSAAIGAALRAKHGWLCNEKGHFVPFSEVFGPLEEAYPHPVAIPDVSCAAMYADMAGRLAKLEETVGQSTSSTSTLSQEKAVYV